LLRNVDSVEAEFRKFSKKNEHLCWLLVAEVCEEDVKVCMALSLLLEWNGLTRSALDWSQKALASTESSETRFADEGAQVWTMAKLNTARLLWYVPTIPLPTSSV
jgi:hypothetical protein